MMISASTTMATMLHILHKKSRDVSSHFELLKFTMTIYTDGKGVRIQLSRNPSCHPTFCPLASACMRPAQNDRLNWSWL